MMHRCSSAFALPAQKNKARLATGLRLGERPRNSQRAVGKNTRSDGGFRLLSCSVTSSLVGLSWWNQPDRLPAGLFPGSAGFISQQTRHSHLALGAMAVRSDSFRFPVLDQTKKEG
jgi:hypothetical protein